MLEQRLHLESSPSWMIHHQDQVILETCQVRSDNSILHDPICEIAIMKLTSKAHTPTPTSLRKFSLDHGLQLPTCQPPLSYNLSLWIQQIQTGRYRKI